MNEVSRRRFFGYAGATAAGAAFVGTGCAGPEASGSGDAGSSATPQLLAFRSPHQVGVTAPMTAAAIVAALDVRAESRAELGETLSALSEAIETVMSGEPYEVLAGGFPPLDTGILGAEPGPTNTSIVVGFGDSLFDERFGLGPLEPIELQPMPRFANDHLLDDERSHGDIALTISAATAEAAVHALRQVLRATRGRLVPRWTKEGFANLIRGVGPGEAPMRNLMGFKDGSANLDAEDPAVMNRHVWIQPEDAQPEWAIGGTYQAIRVIRMMVEFWDRTRLSEQEAVFGRHRNSGAPLGGRTEADSPVFGDDLSSHIARANPRTPGSERHLILRKGFNYTSGLDGNDQLDQGLIFMSFQRSLEDGFIAVQRRLDGEALEEYVRPTGGGFYFVPPGPGEGEYLGQRLIEA